MAKQNKKFDYNDAFPKRLRGLIKCKGVTFDTLAEAFDTTRQTVSNWQAGSTVPDAISISVIANYFGVTTDYLLGLSDVKSYDASIRATEKLTGLSEEAIGIIAYGLNKAQKDKLSKMIEFYNTIK